MRIWFSPPARCARVAEDMVSNGSLRLRSKIIAMLPFVGAWLISTSVLGQTPAPHWDIQYSYRQVDSTLSINDFLFTSETRGIVCGFTTDRHGKENPLVLVTQRTAAALDRIPVKETGLSIYFLDDSTGWMVTDKGIWQTTESGATGRNSRRRHPACCGSGSSTGITALRRVWRSACSKRP